VFNNAIGSCEEILGEITREIRNIAENYSLNKDELKLKLQQLADNKIRLIQEEEILEQRQVELFGIRLSEDQMKKEIEDASSFWLSPESIRKIITLYLKEKFEKEQDVILGDKPLKTLRLSQDARSSLLLDFQQLSRQNTNVYRDWENWLKGGNPHLFITFESSCAMKHPEAAFIMPLHPLVKQATMSIDTSKRVITSLKVKTNKVAAGRYEFAIYQWCFQGIKEDLILQPITLYDALTVNLYHLLEKAVDAKIEITGIWDSPVWEQLDTQHYRLWSQAREKHQQKTKELAEYRRESLSTSHRARIALLHEQLNQTNNDKIQRMRQSQIYTAEADYARRIQELDIAMERADITSGPVGYGIIEIY
jgi:ATP-dependent helicase HepA